MDELDPELNSIFSDYEKIKMVVSVRDLRPIFKVSEVSRINYSSLV